MARKVKAKKYFHVFSTGYGAEDFKGCGEGECAHIPTGLDESNVSYFDSKENAMWHPAYRAHLREMELLELAAEIEVMKDEGNYIGKRIDADKWLTNYPTEQQSHDAEQSLGDELPEQYPDLSLEIELLGKTAWYAATEIRRAVTEHREIEKKRLKLKAKAWRK